MMANVAEGFIKAISIKDRNTKRGMAKVYSFKLDNDQWYDNGFSTLTVNKGDQVKVMYKDSEYGPKIERYEVVGSDLQGKPSGGDPNRERKIIRQSSLKSASEVYSGKGGKTLDANAVLQLAETFYNWVMEEETEEPTEDEDVPF